MIIKIGNKIFDSKNHPIMVILQDDDIKNIYKIKGNEYRYFIYEGSMSEEDIENFMSDIDPTHGA
jgi:hypothetical protein